MAEAKVHTFHMEMTCEGCSNAAKRVLKKEKFIDEDESNIEIDLTKKTIKITSDQSVDVLLATLKKTGKEVEYISPQ